MERARDGNQSSGEGISVNYILSPWHRGTSNYGLVRERSEIIMSGGYTGKILFIDLTSGSIEEETLPETIYRSFLGGEGLGVRILYQRMKPKIDPLGSENIIGFAAGVLTGTPVPMASRYIVFTKSPLTNAWGQANSGGYFGSELKAAGYDAVFFTGISPKPVYLLINKGKAELRDAAHLWGRDTTETEEILHQELGDRAVRVACIGPSGESLSLIAAVINDKGRAAGRCGVGAVMGAKRLKAIAVKGTRKMTIAEPNRFRALREGCLKDLRESKGLKGLKTYGTCETLSIWAAIGEAPIKNWSLNGREVFPNADKISDANVTKYQVRKFACSRCPIGCGGIVSVGKGPYALIKGHKPEYETLASFGTMCLNDDVESIIKANDICNRYGLDTISAGTTIAFAIECYEQGIIGNRETEGIELTWGNAPAIVAMLGKIARREGFGGVLADGVKKAAEQIGGDAQQYAIHVFGQEPGCRDARLVPSRGIGYIADPAPGRHTGGTAQVMFEKGGILGPYPEFQAAQKELKDSQDRGKFYAIANKYHAMADSSGLCIMALGAGTFPLVEFVSAVTGWDFTVEEALAIGHRVQTLRQAFIIREGISPKEFSLPERMSSVPSTGPLAGITRDFESLRSSYYAAMGWETQGVKTGHPLEQTLRELGLQDLVAES